MGEIEKKPMSQNEKIKIGIKAIRSYAQEHYGWDAKFDEDKKDLWDKHMEVIQMIFPAIQRH